MVLRRGLDSGLARSALVARLARLGEDCDWLRSLRQLHRLVRGRLAHDEVVVDRVHDFRLGAMALGVSSEECVPFFTREELRLVELVAEPTYRVMGLFRSPEVRPLVLGSDEATADHEESQSRQHAKRVMAPSTPSPWTMAARTAEQRPWDRLQLRRAGRVIASPEPESLPQSWRWPTMTEVFASHYSLSL